MVPNIENLLREIEGLKSENVQLKEDLAETQILLDNTIEHGEAIENELADKNALLTQTKKRLDSELNDARNYVHDTLPPPRTEFPKTEWIAVPSTELGGDSFGYHWIDDDHFAIYLLDVCGHGVGAALLSVTAINVLRSASLPHTDMRDPSAVLTALNNDFLMDRQGGMYFTIWYGVYQVSTRILQHSSAGHPPAILVRNTDGIPKAHPLVCTGMVCGGLPDSVYKCLSFVLEPDDSLFVVSDGAFEIFKPEGGMLQFPEFVDYVARCTPSNAIAQIMEWLRGMNGPGPLEDDCTILKLSF